MAVAVVQKSDEELVAAYQRRGDMLSLTHLRTRMTPLIQSQVGRYMTGPGHIARSSMEAKADELMIEAAKSFKPNMGAAFKTHLFNHLRRLDRYTKANANVAHVPEARANMITNFTTQLKVLEDQKRRPPTDEELADHMVLPVATIKLMRKSLRRELPWSQVAGPQEHSLERARIEQLLDDIYYELTPDERVVFEHLMGRGRKQLAQGQDIARATGFSQAKVSTLRKRIAERLRPYVGTQTVVTL